MHGTFKTIETKADPFSLDTLIAWLEKQPATECYDYYDCDGKCLLDQYATAQGLNAMEPFLYSRLHNVFDEDHRVAQQRPFTFGAALKRARKARS